MKKKTIEQLAVAIQNKHFRLSQLASKIPKCSKEVQAIMESTERGLQSMLDAMTETENMLAEALAQMDFETAVKEAKRTKDPEQTAILLHKYPNLLMSNELDINVCNYWSIISLCMKHPFMIGRVDERKMEKKFRGSARYGRYTASNYVMEKWFNLAESRKLRV